jgi:hypothetical protein
MRILLKKIETLDFKDAKLESSEFIESASVPLIKLSLTDQHSAMNFQVDITVANSSVIDQ